MNLVLIAIVLVDVVPSRTEPRLLPVFSQWSVNNLMVETDLRSSVNCSRLVPHVHGTRLLLTELICSQENHSNLVKRSHSMVLLLPSSFLIYREFGRYLDKVTI
jgi:hypothetical protein